MKILKTKQDKEEFIFWIETLRAGILPRGEGKLMKKDDNGNDNYCCLGIAAACIGDPLNFILPMGDSHKKWLHLISTRKFEYKKEFHELWELNDIKNLPHPEIADIAWEQMKHEL